MRYPLVLLIGALLSLSVFIAGGFWWKFSQKSMTDTALNSEQPLVLQDNLSTDTGVFDSDLGRPVQDNPNQEFAFDEESLPITTPENSGFLSQELNLDEIAHYSRGQNLLLQESFFSQPAKSFHVQLGPLSVQDSKRCSLNAFEDEELRKDSAVVDQIEQFLKDLMQGIRIQGPFLRTQVLQWQEDWNRLSVKPKRAFVGQAYVLYSEEGVTQKAFPIALQTTDAYSEGYFFVSQCELQSTRWCIQGAFISLLDLEEMFEFQKFQAKTEFLQNVLSP